MWRGEKKSTLGDIHSNSAKQVRQSIAYPNLSSISTFNFQGNSAFLEVGRVQNSFSPTPFLSVLNKKMLLSSPSLSYTELVYRVLLLPEESFFKAESNLIFVRTQKSKGRR